MCVAFLGTVFFLVLQHKFINVDLQQDFLDMLKEKSIYACKAHGISFLILHHRKFGSDFAKKVMILLLLSVKSKGVTVL